MKRLKREMRETSENREIFSEELSRTLFISRISRSIF